MDYFLRRSHKYIPYDEFSYQILNRAIDCEFVIVISDILIIELQKFVKIDELNEILYSLKLKHKIQKINLDKRNIVSKLHFPDSAHVYMAKKLNCAYFVTNDKEILFEEDFAISSQFL